jgi:hypothetical protein
MKSYAFRGRAESPDWVIIEAHVRRRASPLQGVPGGAPGAEYQDPRRKASGRAASGGGSPPERCGSSGSGCPRRFRRGQAPTRATQALLSSRSDRIALGNVAEAPLRQRDKSLGDSLAESWPTEEFGESVSRQAIRRERGE